MRRLAVWSGPRNLSTALMRSFSSRCDCVVSDEPFYASYLATTGLSHPGRSDVLSSQPQDWQEVAYQTAEGSAPVEKPLWYQKHMAQHMDKAMLAPWLDHLEHAFLIRHPAQVIHSYLKIFPSMTLAETGLPWQVLLYNHLRQTRNRPPEIIDAHDLQLQPEATLRRLCHAFRIPWKSSMLHWPSGPHPQDGVWAPHWYKKTWESTGFTPTVVEDSSLPQPNVPFLDEAIALYDHLLSCSKSETQPTTD